MEGGGPSLRSEAATNSGQAKADLSEAASGIGANRDPVTPSSFLILYNVGKRHNIGMILRSATAFNVREVCIIGNRRFSSFGDQGTEVYINFRLFEDVQQCCTYLRDQQGCRILGVEIADSAVGVQNHPFQGPTAFMLGNEGAGLSDKQVSHCDGLIYIPQHGPGTASLNVAIAASIVLHHFAIWAGMAERERTGPKYNVAPRPLRMGAKGTVPLTAEEVAAKRELREANSQAQATPAGSDTDANLLEESESPDESPAALS
ncbi:hypothetical protein WJX73_000525 [Symbiochloris irregularis]|uniref:tRNA/rRNA methyltransferase SpoU type domain-containing protein n=1 Tax=Symbiochloris irregularis TaxID=706552 RepID=A0AAW1PEQ6_9CHLO